MLQRVWCVRVPEMRLIITKQCVLCFWHQGSNAFYLSPHVIQGSRGKVIINKKSFGVTLHRLVHHHVDTNTDYGHCDIVTNTRTDGGEESVSVCRGMFCVFVVYNLQIFCPQTQQDVSDYLRWASSKPFLVRTRLTFDSIRSLLRNSAWCCFLLELSVVCVTHFSSSQARWPRCHEATVQDM